MIRRTLTPDEITEQQRGARLLGPGIWMDREGGLHVSVPDLLELAGLADTPANRDIIEEIVEAELRRQMPNATIVRQD